MNRNNNVQNVAPDDPYKEWEFKKFLKLIKEDNVAHWYIIAEALNVSVKTLERWKRHPLAHKAMAEAVSKALEGMEVAGSKDWRMYQAKLTMIGVNPAKKERIIFYEALKEEDDPGIREEAIRHLKESLERFSVTTEAESTAG